MSEGSNELLPDIRTPARQSAAIQQWRPWEHSTGTKSEERKAQVSRNPYKGGTRAILRELGRLLAGAMRSIEAHRVRGAPTAALGDARSPGVTGHRL
jgi:hypothetical protein